MTVAEQIKRSTLPLSIERFNMAHDYLIKGSAIIWLSGVCREYHVVYGEATFIDGSTLEVRAYP